MEEVFKQFRDTWYEVSNKGRVFSNNYCKTGQRMEMTYYEDKDGYLRVNLMIEKREHSFPLHRVVMEAFCGASNLQVNHKDENKKNNSLENLEYCDSKYNNNYGRRNKKVAEKLSKPVVQMDLHGNVIKTFPSLMEITRQLGYNFKNISACCLGKRKTAHGFKWKYSVVR